MRTDRPASNESPSDKLAASLRDCILGLIALAMIGWLIYFGTSAIITQHLDLGVSVRPSKRWFTGPLNGTPAVLAGCSFLSLAAAFISITLSHPFLINRTPFWLRRSYWCFFPAFLGLYIAARFLSGK